MIMKWCRVFFSIVLITVLFTFPLAAQEGDSEEPVAESADEGTGGEGTEGEGTEEPDKSPEIDFGLTMGLGANTFNEDGEKITYQYISLLPELTIGKFGLGLDLTMNFRFTGGESNDQFVIREEDWVPDDASDFLPTYLPKFRYIRWAQKGDPLYILFGQINNGTLGNGFIMSGYSNTLLLPDTPIFGLTLDMDGKLFNFPYVGIETIVGNLAAFDVMGGRLFFRPLAWWDVPVLQNLELGTTVVGDRDPYYHVEDGDFDDDGEQDSGSVVVAGADFRLPILSLPVYSLATFGDIAFENEAAGGMFGIEGRFFEIIPYRGEIRILGENFIPVYFDATYDLFRPLKYEIFSGEESVPGYVGWLGQTGLSILDDKLGFLITLDGPFNPPEPENEDNFNNYPHLRAVFFMADGVIPGISFNLTYDKKYLREFDDLIDPEGAFVGATLGLRAGPAVISLIYQLRYNPNIEGDNKWETTSGIQTSISLF